jgi:Flp pilus assembly protein TadG
MKGQALVELALSMTIILFLLAGAVEFGLIFFQYVQLRDAAQEGGLNGAVCQDEEFVVRRVKGSSFNPINLPEDENVSVQVVRNDGYEGGAFTVRASYRHHFFAPFISSFFNSDSIVITASVTDTILTTSGCK